VDAIEGEGCAQLREEVGRFRSEWLAASNQRSVAVPSITSHIMKYTTATTFALFVLAASARDEKPCTVHDEGGTYFDLNKLSAKYQTIAFHG
jgi:hypothetical protein